MKRENQILPYDEVVEPNAKYYVYFIYLPDRPNPVYVGKGSGGRYKSYSRPSYRVKFSNRILRFKLNELHESGLKYLVRIVFESNDEEEVLDTEAFYISYYGRLFNNTGILYNFETGGMTGMPENITVRKPIYIDGFVFDSMTRACEKLNLSSSMVYNKIKDGFASYIEDDELPTLSRFYGDSYESSLKFSCARGVSKPVVINGSRFGSLTEASKAFGYGSGSSLLHHIKMNPDEYSIEYLSDFEKPVGPRAMVVEGVWYPTKKSAAVAYGKKPENLIKYLEDRGIDYKIFPHDKSKISSSKPKKITINEVTYENSREAAKAYGYKNHKSFMRKVRRNPDKFVYHYHEN